MATVKDPQSDIGDADAVSEQSSNTESNVGYFYFENITHTWQHHDDSSNSHTKNGGNTTAESDTQPPIATVKPNKPHISIRLIGIGHNSPRQRNLTKLSDHENSFEDGFDSDGGRGTFMGAVDKEGKQYSEEEVLTIPRKMMQLKVQSQHLKSQRQQRMIYLQWTWRNWKQSWKKTKPKY